MPVILRYRRIRRGIIRHAALCALCRYRHKAHWAESRTGWDDRKQGYALGELAAEIASCYVSAELGIPQGEDLGNHASYLRSWLDAMRGDRNFIFQAAKQASKVTDFLLGFVKKPEPEAAGAMS
jgi:antirestriction protein ArdC